MKTYRVSIRTKWGSIMVDDVVAEDEAAAIIKAKKMLLYDIENYSDYDSVDEY